MELIRFDNPRAFLDRTAAFLQSREAENGIIYGTVTRLAARPAQPGAEPPLLLAVEEADQVVAAAIRTPPFRLVLTRAPAVAVAIIADALARQRCIFPGVVAPGDTARLFVLAWSKLSRQVIRPGFRLTLYEARRVIEPQGVPGRLDEPTSSETDLMVQWAERFVEEVKVLSADLRTRTLEAMAEHRLFVWRTDDGRPVCGVTWSGATPNGARLTSVYTPPENRRRGYASAAVAAVTRRLLEHGRQFAVLYAEKNNTTANAIYQRIGFEPVSDSEEYVFD